MLPGRHKIGNKNT